MIRLLYGAGSDAAAATLLSYIQKDLEAGGKVILLVPEQETVSAERRMVAALPASAQLSFEVLNFTRLANRTFRTVGGLCYRYATPGAEALFMWRTLRALTGTLKQYGKDAANLPRLTDKMLSAAVQFGAYCVTPDLLAETAEKLENDDPLRAKLTDIATVLSAYESEVGKKYDHVRDDVGRLFRLLGEHPALYADTHVYIDSFTDFTAEEWRVIGALLRRVPSLTMTTPMPTPRAADIHLGACKKTVERLKRLARETGLDVCFCGEETDKPRTSLEKIRRDLFCITAEKAPLGFADDGGLTLMKCPSPYAEAEWAAATVQKLVRAGCRYRDVTVVVRDAAAWCGILDAAFEKEGIPYFLSEKTDVTLRPLIKLILSALAVWQYGWRREDVIGCLKTGLTGIGGDDINCFEEYLDVWKPRGRTAFGAPFCKNPGGYREAPSARDKRILAAAERVRQTVIKPLFALCDALNTATTMADYCRALYAFLQQLNVPEQLKDQASEALEQGEKREAEELSRLFAMTLGALETTADVIGDLPADRKAFAEALRLVFARTDIGTIPTSADEVMVGSAATLRAERPRFAVVLGLNEGQFPAVTGRGGLFSDTEKRKLADNGVELDGSSADAAGDELFYVWRAFTLPREKLFLSYAATSAEGGDAAPSFAVTRVKALFDKETFKEQAFGKQSLLDLVFTPTGAFEHLPELNEADRQTVLTLLRERGETDKADRYDLPMTERRNRIPTKQAATLFDDRSYNPTGLEKFSECPFEYYCDKVLRLRQTATDDLDYSDTGTLMHDILENVFRTVRAEKRDFDSYTDDEIRALVKRCADDYTTRLQQSGEALSPRSAATVKAMTDSAFYVVRALFRDLSFNVFKPALFELDLTKMSETAVTHLNGGKTIPLTGKIDRVDLAEKDGRTYVRIIDYKTGNKEFKISAVEKGFFLQMPLYLYALCQNDHPLLNGSLGVPGDTRLQPAGLTYVRAITERNKEGHLTAADNATVDAAKGNGVVLDAFEAPSEIKKLSAAEFDDLFTAVQTAVERITDDMQNGRADVDPRTADPKKTPCGYCAYGAVCRVAGEKEEDDG